ncbi:alpha/beta hydrolase [Parafrankia sp. FMc2]|uniref:alpha/beta hydrolase n=1 Tax=Parafrankia sp. FMc2 TaxID=3233196 RepID=UPI0034D5AE5D
MTSSTATISPRLTEGGPGPDVHPTGEAVRAVVVMLTGRGENPEPYEWLARRLALDGYTASVVPGGSGAAVSGAGSTARAVGEARRPGVPFVLLGSDAGALAVLAMAGSPALRPDGLVLLGLPLLHVPVAGIPVADPPPRALPDMPILLLHGRDDQISPLPLVRMTTRTAPRADLAVVPGSHAVLAGPGRRCVPARVLLFIEGLIAD